ncbi:hypothetical protein PoB_000156700 [Plakobranchus ocellatus]|uniref:Uncharacterized protein n=1 Tax=Plakobranchus ocellatus TaxID=259542 RepID=A0AAV3XX69_9GAST|nr:hypothetical protein PoB_000156700 [Plakobranchus ocellatus]
MRPAWQELFPLGLAEEMTPCRGQSFFNNIQLWGVCATVDSATAFISAGSLLLQVRAPPLSPGLTEDLKA